MISVALPHLAVPAPPPGGIEVDLVELDAPCEHVLRVCGAKPLRIHASILAEATSWSATVPAWHEVALFRTEDRECAVAVRMRKKALGEADIHHAELFATLEDALDWLEEFDPTAGLTPGFDASDRRVSTAEIALASAALRQQADMVTRQWRGLLGDLLHRFAQPG